MVIKKKGFSLDNPDLPSLLRAHGLRVTPQRLAVLRVLNATPEHLGAEEIFEEIRENMPSVSLATVYHALAELRRVGQVRALPVFGRVRYDLAARGPHHHLVCERCHRVVDLPMVEVPKPDAITEEAQGFEILTAEVIFRSICPDCRNLGTIEGADASNLEQGAGVSGQRGTK
jgi:Fur family ferric uptake transcriptional regulator